MLAALALAALVGIAPAAAPASCAGSPLQLGPADAPLRIVVYIDPFANNTLPVWLELRRLVSDHAGLAGAQLIPLSTAMVDNPADERVLRWLVGVSARGEQEAALRLLDRDGRERVGLRLADPAGQAEVAAEIGLDPQTHAAAIADPCAAAALEQGRAALRRLHAAAGGYIGRPPIFVIGERPAFEDSATLEGVRRELGRERQRLRGHRVPARGLAGAAGRKGVSPRLVRPPASAGMIVGGVGLPHRLVVFADHDENLNFSLIGPALEFRRQQPGRLAIQVIARGNTAAARQLRLRLCAAGRLGLELEYLRILAREGSGGRREPRSQGAAELVQLLDTAPEAQTCELGEPELERGPGGVTALPEGVWLDGTAVGQSDLDALPARLGGFEAAQRPLDAVFSAAAPEP